MKTPPIFIPLLLAGVFALAVAPTLHAAAPTEPAELSQVRKTYHETARRTAQPIIVRYIGQLEALRNTYTRAGQLAATVTAQRELNQVKRSAGQTAEATPPPAPGSAAETEPPEMVQLRNAYRDDIWRAGQPAHLRYQEDLKFLKNKYLQATNLANAQAIEQELQNTTQSDGLDFMINEQMLEGSVWDWPFEAGERHIRFDPGGAATATWGHLTRPCQWLSANTVNIHPWIDPKRAVTLQFNFQFTRATVTGADRPQLIGGKLTLLTAPAITATAALSATPLSDNQEPFSGLSWPRAMTGSRVEFHTDHSFLEVWGNQKMPGKWHMINKTDAQVVYSVTRGRKINHYRIAADGTAERLEDHVHWPK